MWDSGEEREREWGGGGAQVQLRTQLECNYVVTSILQCEVGWTHSNNASKQPVKPPSAAMCTAVLRE